MCGIVGILDCSPTFDALELDTMISGMRDALSHRGPEDTGNWNDVNGGIALGHRRLSIIDLSSAGHQPMISHCGRYVLVFNGEIYNFRELRSGLESTHHTFTGESDTEVLLAAIVKYGLDSALKQTRGMFALGLWDRKVRQLYLARDRFGEKPLYYYTGNGVFLFASELKALYAHPGFTPELNHDALCQYFRHNYIPAPNTIYRNTRQLLPGTWLRIGSDCREPEIKTYWSFNDRVLQALEKPYTGSMSDATSDLESLLVDTVRHQMIADVPLGAMLSGGIDSSCIVAMMMQVHSGPVRTFSVAYDENVYNEADHAAAVARHLQTEHTELHIKASDVLNLIPSLPELYDEPFADASQLPTTLISRLTRQHVTVALSGDAGDEVFGGYNRYFWAARIHRLTGWLSSSFRGLIASILHTPSVGSWDNLYDALSPVLPRKFRFSLPGDKIYKLASVLQYQDQEDLYRQLVSHWSHSENLVNHGKEEDFINSLKQNLPGIQDYSRWMMYLDTLSYLPNDILTKVDRAAMSCSLETRVPFLDHRIVEFTWSLPIDYLIHSGQGKQVLRQVLYKYVPKDLLDRPKMGFGVPIDDWLRGPLRDWAENLLDTNKMKQEGYLDPEPIHLKWREHLSGHRNWQYHLWSVLMFQAWKERWE